MKTLIENFKEMLEIGGDLQVARRLGDTARATRLQEQYDACHAYADQMAVTANRGRATESSSGRILTEATTNKTFRDFVAADKKGHSQYAKHFGKRQ